MASYDTPETIKPPRRRYSLAQAFQDMQHSENADMMQRSGDRTRAMLAPTTAGVPAKVRRPIDLTKLKKIGGDVATGVNNLAPYYSNIVNAFRKAPMPIKGVMNTSPTLNTVDYSNERNDVYRNATAADRNTERNVDSNTAEAVKLYRKGQTFHDVSSINDRQNQVNLATRNQQAMLDYQNSVGNNAKTDEYNQSLVERDIANSNAASANIANVGDKIVGIRNEQQKGQVEMDKAKVLSSVFARSGVLDRNKIIKQMYPDLLGNGGPMGVTDSIPVKRLPTIPLSDSTAWKNRTFPLLTTQGLDLEKLKMNKMLTPTSYAPIVQQKIGMIEREQQRRFAIHKYGGVMGKRRMIKMR